LLGLLHSNLALSATLPSAANGIDHVWFGTLTNALPDGKISHDVTALILEQDLSKLSGSVGPSIDRLAPIEAGSISGNNISFHTRAAGIASLFIQTTSILLERPSGVERTRFLI